MNIRMVFAIIAAVIFLPRPTHAEELSKEQTAFFESKIRPVLVKECFGCHSDRTGKVRGGLRLDTKQSMLLGGGSGPAIVPGKPEESLLLQSMMHDGLAMPPKRKLSDKVIADFRYWIETGAPDPRKTAAAAVNSTVSKTDIQRARKSFWAYQPVAKTTVPNVERKGWAKTEIDRFILAGLEQAELKPAADDQPHRILRRLSFDLVGLPPSLKQIEFFDKLWNEDHDSAIEKVVDHYLKQPQYGERWGRHWLDVARYGESTGHAVNLTYPHAFRYRDYVIDSFNKDKPYNAFVQEQIAGDLLPAKTDEQWAEQLVGTSFLAIGPKNINEMDSLQFRADLIDEQVDATSRVFLGMSLACARCHDHKFDAIPQSDYYAMAGFFSSTKTFFGSQLPSKNPMVQQDSGILEYPLDDPGPGQKTYSKAELQELKDKIESISAEQRQATGPSYRGIQSRIYKGQLENELEGLDKEGRPVSYCMGVQCSSSPRDATLLYHGEVDQPGNVIPRGFPEVLTTRPVRIKRNNSGRRELAKWIADEKNPLTARVMVNRIWHYIIGQGIVSSPNDFGATGQPPSHPELLDYLTVRFTESGWSVKSLIRDIATSRVYRMRCDMNEEAFAFDPTNSLLWRAHPRRLTAEAIRDNMLAVSGQLDPEPPHGSEIAKAGFVRIRNGVLEELSAGIGGMTGMGRMGGGAGMTGGMGRGGGIGPGSRTGSESGQSGRGPRGRMQSGIGGRAQSGRGPGGGMRLRGSGGRNQSSGNEKNKSQIPAPSRLDMVDETYRSVYLPFARNETPRSLDVFDFADSNTTVASRATSNTADQALYLLNNPFVLQQANAFAKRLNAEAKTQNRKIQLAFLLAYGRPPRKEESRAAADFLRDMKSSGNGLELFCQSLLASAEFRYVY